MFLNVAPSQVLIISKYGDQTVRASIHLFGWPAFASPLPTLSPDHILADNTMT